MQIFKVLNPHIIENVQNNKKQQMMKTIKTKMRIGRYELNLVPFHLSHELNWHKFYGASFPLICGFRSDVKILIPNCDLSIETIMYL